MCRALKTLLLWLMMIAIPVQGMAAVVKASCGPRHHSLAESFVLDIHVHHHGHDGEMHHHDAAPEDTPDDTESAEASASGTASVKTSTCSACAYCCTGAVAPPMASHWSPAKLSPEILFPSPEFRVDGHIPAGLERPPKQLSA